MLSIIQLNSSLTAAQKEYLETLYQLNSRRLWYIAVKILHDKELAEDAVQQVFEKVVHKVALLMSFEDISKANKYIYIAAKNTAISMLRSRNKIDITEACDLIPDSSDTPEDAVISQMDIESLKDSVSQMNPTYGEAFFLRYFVDLDYSEIAYALSITISMAQHRVSRAKAILRRQGR